MAAVFDFSAARPSRAQLAAGGCVAVARYVKKSLPNSFDLSAAERAQYLSWGLGVLYNAEQSAGDLVQQGTQYFKDYGSYVRDRLLSFGVNPAGVNVALSCDTGVSSSQLPGVMNNYSAFAAAVAPFGTIGYAQTQIIDLLVAEGISPAGAKHWLPAAYSWSGYPNMALYLTYPHAGMVQQVGSPVAGTDLNIPIDLAAMGFEWPAGHDPSGGGTEIDMQLDDTPANYAVIQKAFLGAQTKTYKWVDANGVEVPVAYAQYTADARGVSNDNFALLNAKLDALSGAITSEQATILAAIAGIDEGMTDAQADAAASEISTSLLATLPPAVASATVALMASKLGA